MENKSVITIAVGNKYYYQLTKNLINSFLLHNSNNHIKFNLITDDISAFNCFENEDKIIINYIHIDNEDKSFTSKFHLIEYALQGENLFIDCDCLIYRDLTPIFNELSIFNFTVLGTLRKDGEFFCDISKIINTHQIDCLPVFVGSVYYFKQNEVSKRIFKQAHAFKEKYDEMGFVRLRGKENEEPLLALSMALNEELPYQGSLNIKADAMFFDNIQAHILKGTNRFRLIDAEKASIYKNSDKNNAYIIHYNASYSDSWQYHLETYRLLYRKKYSVIKEIYALVRYKYYMKILETFKNIFRPIFRIIFGTRKIKQTIRTQHLNQNIK